MILREGLRLATAYHERVWGGQRLFGLRSVHLVQYRSTVSPGTSQKIVVPSASYLRL